MSTFSQIYGRKIRKSLETGVGMGQREASLYWLSGPTEKAFAEFFYDAVRERKTSDGHGHFVLADAAHYDNAWYVDMIGMDDKQKYDAAWDDDVPICQSVTCSVCNTTIRSWAKHAICPVCGSAVYGT